MGDRRSVKIVLKLEANGKCIQAVARRARSRLEAKLLREDGEIDIERTTGELELLNDFLTQSDFGALRASDPALAGTADAVFELIRGSSAQAVILHAPPEGGPADP